MGPIGSPLTRKKEICRKYHMSDEDVSEVLGVDTEPNIQKTKIKRRCVSTVSSLEKRSIEWNHPFEFLVRNYKQAVLTVQFKSQGPETGSVEETHGEIRLEVAPLLAVPTQTNTIDENVNLPGTDICLQLRRQVRFLTKPASGGRTTRFCSSAMVTDNPVDKKEEIRKISRIRQRMVVRPGSIG